MKEEEMKQLRELASKATPGPWDTRGERMRPRAIVIAGTEQIADAAEHVHWTDAQCERNAAFIAAAHPQTVIALLDELERVRNHALDTFGKYREQITALTSERDSALESARLARMVGGDAALEGFEGLRDVVARTAEVLSAAKIEPADGDDHERFIDERVAELVRQRDDARAVARIGEWSEDIRLSARIAADRNAWKQAHEDALASWDMDRKNLTAARDREKERAVCLESQVSALHIELGVANMQCSQVEQQLAAMTAARDEACRLALTQDCFPESVEERVEKLRKVGAP